MGVGMKTNTLTLPSVPNYKGSAQVVVHAYHKGTSEERTIVNDGVEDILCLHKGDYAKLTYIDPPEEHLEGFWVVVDGVEFN